ncbi:MAG TPA: CBS domain-containing protein [bacterium]|nr:CBS domain-containing protein [bacterium]
MTAVGSIIAQGIPLKWIPVSASVLDAVKIMVGHDVGALPVLDEDRLVGVFSERDLMKRVIVKGLDPSRTRVADVMSRDIYATDVTDDHSVAMRIMSEQRVRHLPVLDRGRLAGFLSMRDLMRAELEGKEFEIKSLTDYIYYVPPTPE